MNTRAGRVPTAMVYVLMVVVGVAAFLYPFWLPATALTRGAWNRIAPYRTQPVPGGPPPRHGREGFERLAGPVRTTCRLSPPLGPTTHPIEYG